MELEQIEFLENIIKKDVLLEDQLITVNQLSQKMNSLFLEECSVLGIREKLNCNNELLELTEGSFVSKNNFYKFHLEVKDEDNVIRKISRKYFKRLTKEEYENLILLLESDEDYLKLLNKGEEISCEPIEVNEPELQTPYTVSSEEIEIKTEIESEIDIEEDTEIDVYKKVSRSKINYKVDEIQGKLIDLILHGKKALRIKHFKKIEILANHSVEELIKICSRRPDLFYFPTKKSIFFKPLLGAKLVEENKSIIPLFKVEEIVVDIFKSRTINKKALVEFIQEEDKVFNMMETSIEVLCNLDKYFELLIGKYEVETRIIKEEPQEKKEEKPIKIQEPKEIEIKVEERKDWTYDSILEEGLKTGQVKDEWLQAINFDIEDEVEDYYEAKEELEYKDIKII